MIYVMSCYAVTFLAKYHIAYGTIIIEVPDRELRNLAYIPAPTKVNVVVSGK